MNEKSEPYLKIWNESREDGWVVARDGFYLSGGAEWHNQLSSAWFMNESHASYLASVYPGARAMRAEKVTTVILKESKL